MSTARYRAFVAVAHHGSLSAAARALQLSQPTISAQ
ncbi:MAG: LysR family transcriptional regulator, partial [Comamonas sp.]